METQLNDFKGKKIVFETTPTTAAAHRSHYFYLRNKNGRKFLLVLKTLLLRFNAFGFRLKGMQFDWVIRIWLKLKEEQFFANYVQCDRCAAVELKSGHLVN